MMTPVQYLLGKLSEEAAEVIVRASKASRFGILEVQEGKSQNNLERLKGELDDLLIVVTLLQGLGIDLLAATPEQGLAEREAKVVRVLKYYDYSVEQGCVEGGLREELERSGIFGA